MNKLKKLLAAVLLVVFTLTFSGSSEAFDNQAHVSLSQRATTLSNLDSFLRTVLGFEFSQGIFQSGLAGKRVAQLIPEGALLEDSPFWRVVNHFHNPKLSWDQAGLWPPGFGAPIGYSSVVWSQLQNQGNLGSKSWHQARDAYLQR